MIAMLPDFPVRALASTWLRFTWDLKKVPATEPVVPAPYHVRAADADEEEVVRKVALSAFGMDSGWSHLQGSFVEKIRAQIAAAFEKNAGNCLALVHGTRIIGASVLNPDPSAAYHLLTGPCVLHEYRSRSLGSQLLRASLLTLRKAGLETAAGVTKNKTTAARYIYPKFDGVAAAWDSDLETAPRLAA
jgi:predicted N-acetyltransferase YhbS